MPKRTAKNFAENQQGHVYIHEIEVLTEEPLHLKLHAIMLHHILFYVPDTTQPMRTSFVTLDIYQPELKEAMFTLKEAIARFTMVEAEVCVDHLKLLPSLKENGIPHSYGELTGIESAVMRCRA